MTRRAVVLLTDGYDEDSHTPVDEAIEAVKAAHVTVYVIAIGGVAGVSRLGERTLRRLATETGGQTFLPREDALVAVHEQLAADVQNRYLVTYTPTNQERDGTWRRVTLNTNLPYVVRTRAGYTAPQPPPVRPEVEFTISNTTRRVTDFGADDFTVFEDGVRQRVEAFHELVAPVSIVLAIDSSGSMRKSAAEAITAAREFVKALRPEDSLGLLEFADVSRFVHDFTTERQAILAKIDEYTANGGTALYDGLWEALTRLRSVQGRRAIVLVSDGRDENNPGTAPGSLRTVPEVLDLLRVADTTVYTIGLGPKVDRDFLERLASMSGGESHFPEAVEGLKGDFHRVVENLRRRYVVMYTSTNGNRNGGWRNVEIRPRTDSVVVASRGGYFAPER
jgi:VWFA-related protein